MTGTTNSLQYDKETDDVIDTTATKDGAKGLWMQTYTNHRFYGEPPFFDRNVYDIEDIAESLSKKVRWGGHCQGFYSVAQHCVLVARITPHPYKLEGLLHDCTETFLGDIPRPIKAAVPGLREYEDALFKHMARGLGIAEELPECVKEADNILLVTEARDFMGNPEWAQYMPQKPLLGKLEQWTPTYAKTEFMNMYYENAFGGSLKETGV